MTGHLPPEEPTLTVTPDAPPMGPIALPAPPLRSGGLPERPDGPSRRSFVGRIVAIVGIVGGMFLLLVPGILSIRSYLRWSRGESPRPTFAWVTAGVFVAYVVGVTALFAVLYGRPLLEDDFSDVESGWVRTGYVDGAYEISRGPADGQERSVGLIWSEGRFPNVAVEVDVRFLEGAEDAIAAVGCARGSTESGYAFALRPDGGYLIQRFVGNEFELLEDGRTEAPPAGGVVRIRGECRGGYGDHEVRMLVDGRLVAVLAVEPHVGEFDAVTLATGSPSGDPVHVRFDDAFAIAIEPSA